MKFFKRTIVKLFFANVNFMQFAIFVQLVEFYDSSTEYFFRFTQKLRSPNS